MSVIELWWLSLAIAAVVVAIVAVLLGLIIATAKRVDQHAGNIWTVGKQIAGNTVSIWMLEKTNEQVAQMLESAQAIERTTASINDKLQALVSGTGRRG